MHAVILSPEDFRGGISHYSIRLGRAANVDIQSYGIRNIKGKDLVHIQFEYNVPEFAPFGLAFVPYLLGLRLLRKKIVVTLHSVYSIKRFRSNITTSYYEYPHFAVNLAKLYIYLLTKIICTLAHAIIVLNNAAKRILQDEYNVKGNIFYLEFCSYGLREEDLLSREAAKEKLGLRGKIVLFSFGTLHPRKRYEMVISLLPMLRKRYSNITYIISKVLPSSNPRRGQKYLEWLLGLVRRLNVDENVIFADYIPDNQLKYYFGASDAVIFAHRDGAYGSAASKHAMSYLARIICSDASCFRGFENGVHCLKFDSKDDLFEKILKTVEQRPNFSDELRRKIEELDIKNHAKRHLEIYEQVSDGRIRTRRKHSSAKVI